MAIFQCTKCGYSYEFTVSNNYQRKVLARYDHCPKCDQVRQFHFITHSGMVGCQPFKPMGTPGPSKAALYWRKKRGGKSAMAPLDEVCKVNEY